MNLILSYRSETGGGFKSPLRTAHLAAMAAGVKHVQAAVAYVSDERNLVLDDCSKKGIRLEVWSRHDETLPTAIRVMEWALRSNNANLTWKLLGSRFHAKVVWWHGYGVYLGSANFTDAAWNGNCEAGTLILESEFERHDLRDQLESFFAEVNEEAIPLNRQILEHSKEFERYDIEAEKIRREAGERFASSDIGRMFPKRQLADVTKAPKSDKRLDLFLQEWARTLGYLHLIQERLSRPENRPSWVPADSNPGIQVDQFLHGYYYSKVRDGNRYPYEAMYKENIEKREAALNEAVAWWRSSVSAPNLEDHIFEEWEPLHRKMLTRERLERMTQEEFVQVARRVHAINDHGKRRSNDDLGIEIEAEDDHLDAKSRQELHCRDLFTHRNLKGWNPPQLLAYLLFGGPPNEAPRRLYRCVYDQEYKIARLSLSALGEFIGWGLPEHFPPRNDRTNKALRALGFDVKVHSPNRTAVE